MKEFLVISLVCLFFGQFAYATLEGKTFTSDGTIQDGDSWLYVKIYDPPTGHTAVNMTGGFVSEGGIKVYDAAMFNFSGGQPYWIGAYNSSTANVTGASGYDYSVNVADNATMNIISNNPNIAMASAAGSSVLNIYGGTISVYLVSYNSSLVNIYDGTINQLSIQDSSIANLMGGSIPYLNSGSTAMVNVFGHNLAKTSTGGLYGDGQATGFWPDGSPFTINFSGYATYSSVNLIPEPTALLLLGLGVIFLKKSR